MFWTIMNVVHNYDGFSLPTAPELRKRSMKSAFDASNTFKHLSKKTTYTHDRQDWPESKEYMKMLIFLSQEFVILSTDKEEIVELFGRLLYNCIMLQGENVYQGKKGYTYFLPLHFHAAATDWRSNSWNRVWNSSNTKGHRAWVKGVPWDQQAACLACPCVLDRTMDLCHPMYGDCKGQKDPPFTVLPGHTGEGLEELAHWYKCNRMLIDALTFSSEVKSICRYVEAKAVSVHGAFEKVHLQSLTDNQEEIKDFHDARSYNSSIAAVTKKFKKYICNECLHEGEYCATRGGYNCTGPWYAEDYLHAVDKCEPWMIWGLELASYDLLDFRKHILEWNKDRIDQHALSGPSYFNATSMNVTKDTRRHTVVKTVPMQVVYQVILEQKGIKVEMCTTWEQVEKDAKYIKECFGWPLPSWVMALAYFLATEYSSSKFSVRSFGVVDYLLGSMNITHRGITLNYHRGRYSNLHRSIMCLDDLFNIGASKLHTQERIDENKLLRKLVLDEGVFITGKRFRHIVKNEPLFWKELSVKQWKKLSKGDMDHLLNVWYGPLAQRVEG